MSGPTWPTGSGASARRQFRCGSAGGDREFVKEQLVGNRARSGKIEMSPQRIIKTQRTARARFSYYRGKQNGIPADVPPHLRS